MGADVLDAAGSVRASIGDRFHVEVAARKSYLDALLPVFTSRDVSSLFPIPRYADGQARLIYRPDARTTFEVGGLASSDATDRSTPSADPAQRKTESTTLRWGRVYARVRRENQDGSVVTVTPWVGADASTLVSRFGGTPASLTNDATLFGLRASWRGKPIAGVVVTTGVDAEAVSASIHRAGSVTSPPREGDARVFGQAPSDRVNADTWSAVVAGVAPFAEADVSLVNDRLHLLPGLRFDPYVISGSRRTPVEGATPSRPLRVDLVQHPPQRAPLARRRGVAALRFRSDARADGARVVPHRRPRTPVRGAYYDARNDTFEPVLGPQSSIRIPAFFALGVRVSKRFVIGASELENYLDVQNATNRQNPEELVYTRDYTRESAITGLPILPSLGARFAW